ncbi:DUF2141 domain-containing protein [Sphingomonas parva]|uniref:DUF2141 domain-containing protein n=1 Tax=Sphingomonas parva TaxID=2555898 RepID=A0A4Y8ZXX5_9SPHN|nr:DUF2141 domain-containing protein [Sphingomonas parva]TFI60332.1 DUF2141 domain-containing protein [Sphingomonas parva]
MVRSILLAGAAVFLGGAAPSAELELRIERLRNAKGVIHICLTREPAHFPDCKRDPKAITRSVAADASLVRFSGMTPGAYAVALFHDENSNRKLDTMLAIPREGFGFSRNPVVRFGAPKFRQVVIDLGAGFHRETVRMQYML